METETSLRYGCRQSSLVTARQIAQTVVTVLLFVIVMSVVIFLLTGCLGLEGKQKQREQSLVISADCDENTIDVMIDDDQDDQHKEATITK